MKGWMNGKTTVEAEFIHFSLFRFQQKYCVRILPVFGNVCRCQAVACRWGQTRKCADLNKPVQEGTFVQGPRQWMEAHTPLVHLYLLVQMSSLSGYLLVASLTRLQWRGYTPEWCNEQQGTKWVAFTGMYNKSLPGYNNRVSRYSGLIGGLMLMWQMCAKKGASKYNQIPSSQKAEAWHNNLKKAEAFETQNCVCKVTQILL